MTLALHDECLIMLLEEGIVRIHLSLLSAVLLIIPACSRNEPRKTQAASEQTTTSSRQMKNQRDAYVKSMDARLGEFDKKIDGLDQRAGSLTGAAKSSTKSMISQLRDERKNVASKLDDLKGVDVESWPTMKGEVDSAMAGMEHAYDQVSRSMPTPQTTR
jgi:hypothetical protein